MPLTNDYTITRPGQINNAGSITALHIEEFNGLVKGTLKRVARVAPLFNIATLTGASTKTSYAKGKSTVQALVPGQAVDGIKTAFGKTSLTVDTTLLVREVLPMLELHQLPYDAKVEIAEEQGKALQKLQDQAFVIQSIKAARTAANKYGITDGSHTGGTTVTIATAADALDPAILYAKIVDLITALRKKDVDPVADGLSLIVGHDTFAALTMSDLLINTEYKTSDGTNIPALELKTHGVKVIATNNFVGGTTVSGHKLGTAYDGDYTKVVAVLVGARALMAAETIPVTSETFFDKINKQWYVDSWCAYAITPYNVEYAGTLEIA